MAKENSICGLDRLMNDTEIAKAKRDFELKKAAYDVEVQTKVIGDIFDFKANKCFIRKQKQSWLTNCRRQRQSKE